ncbi:MAG: potassium-transporting ATPase subunit KdpA [Vampirovibrionales bacterium]|nr:potassium-transporting ATPase subunit KdpA [Vampirovibrionales bacterium]
MFEITYLLFFLVASLLITVCLGGYMAKVFNYQPTLLTPIFEPIEKLSLYITGIQSTGSQHWKQYAFDFLLFNLVCGFVTFLILSFQHLLPLNPLHLAGMEPWQAFNTICSFVTNTNWQSYSGEVALSNFSQIAGITFMMIVGAVSGLAVCVGFLRGLTNRHSGNSGLGHFYQDFLKSLLYVFLPLLLVGSLFFISQGVPQTLQQQVSVTALEGAPQNIAFGPVASLLTIKQLGTNGGGFFNANSAHPFENPNPLTNFIEILMELAIPMGLVYMFGVWLKNRMQGWVIWGAMMAVFLSFLWMGNAFEQAGNPILSHLPSISVGIDQQSSSLQSGGNMEGKEVRFGVLPSMLFTVATTGTSTGAVNNMHDSLTPIGGLVPLADMMLNIIFGGVGVGLMGFLLYGIIAVFLTGLMVGRTPEIFGKKIEKPEIILASIAILLHPLLILVPTAIATMNDFGLSSLNNLGPHGLSEILYAYTSAAANNGSAFAGLNANTPWYNISLGIVILLGRYISIIALLAIAGSLLSKTKMEPGPGTLPTNTLLFGGVWLGVILIVGALTFVPVLVLGPLADQLAMLNGTLF